MGGGGGCTICLCQYGRISHEKLLNRVPLRMPPQSKYFNFNIDFIKKQCQRILAYMIIKRFPVAARQFLSQCNKRFPIFYCVIMVAVSPHQNKITKISLVHPPLFSNIYAVLAQLSRVIDPSEIMLSCHQNYELFIFGNSNEKQYIIIFMFCRYSRIGCHTDKTILLSHLL